MHVQLTNPSEKSYIGHRISTFFNRKIVLEGVETTVPVLLAEALTEEGKATFTFPVFEEIVGEVTFRFIAPDGEAIAEKVFENITNTVAFEAIPNKFNDILTNDNPAFGTPKKLRGRVIDQSGQHKVGDLQVIIWATTKDDPPG